MMLVSVVKRAHSGRADFPEGLSGFVRFKQFSPDRLKSGPDAEHRPDPTLSTNQQETQ
jgi:hypothetical protein